MGPTKFSAGVVFLHGRRKLWQVSGTKMRCFWFPPPGMAALGRAYREDLQGAPRATILFDDREAAKNLATVEQTCRKLVRAGADRRALLIAVGGGVVGDVAGFVAASYARGIGLVHVPTTLVAQVDSAIGGKTGVNLPEGKNLVGAFYPPKLVLADPELLRTLPLREFRSGIYEIIKYGVIGDASLFRFLERKMEKLLRRDANALDFVIERSVRRRREWFPATSANPDCAKS